MGIVAEDVRRVREQTDIVQLISEHTQLRKSGTQWMGLCPFHGENTPSFSVNYEMGVYHCFGCGESGDAIDYVQNKQHLDFAGAVEYLAAKANISLRYTDSNENEQRGRRKELLDLVQKAVDFYHDCLINRPDARPARDYLRSRGYDGEVARQFSLGWAPKEWDGLSKHLNTSNKNLEDAGLGALNKYNNQYDFFRDRIMFPIFNERGEAVAFGGRQLPDGELPKYKNTSDRAKIYSKKETLYGLNWAKTEASKVSEIVVCEGYTDVIGAHLAGIERTVATCGTSMTEYHAKKLRRFAPRVVLAYDADKAGQAAAERVYGWEEQFELEFAVAELPEGSDPGDLARHDPAALRRAIEEAKPFLQFRIEQELKRGDLSTPEGRARTAANAGHLAMEHPNPMVSDPYIMQIADQCLVTPDQLRTLLQNTVPQQSTKQKNAQIQDKQEEVLHAQIPAVEKQALQFFLHRKDEIEDYLMPVLFLSTAGQLIYKTLKETKGDLHAAREQTDESLSSVLLEIAAGDVIDEDSLGILSRLLALAAKQKADELSSIARQEDSFDDLLEDINFLRRQTDALSEAPQSIEPLEPLLEWFRGIPS
ncbi:MAG: DNA primase [Acidimicrobiaceae bacterium]|nr:DNA primase [Acidimicrobiaceae bacterium]|tara:strand:+ start:56 stop:1834 length:1779 start_codon:yes stop_codon:yes gene_type:complete